MQEAVDAIVERLVGRHFKTSRAAISQRSIIRVEPQKAPSPLLQRALADLAREIAHEFHDRFLAILPQPERRRADWAWIYTWQQFVSDRKRLEDWYAAALAAADTGQAWNEDGGAWLFTSKGYENFLIVRGANVPG